MTDPRVAALAAALTDIHRRWNDACEGPDGWREFGPYAAAALSSHWCEYDEYAEATNAAMNFGDGLTGGRKEAQAELARLRAALADTSLAYDTGFQDGLGEGSAQIARLRKIEKAARTVLTQSLDHNDFVLIHRTDWSLFRVALKESPDD